jgi:hypothetical protein
MAKKKSAKPSVGPAAPRGLNTPRTVTNTPRVLPKRPAGMLPKGGGKAASGSKLVGGTKKATPIKGVNLGNRPLGYVAPTTPKTTTTKKTTTKKSSVGVVKTPQVTPVTTVSTATAPVTVTSTDSSTNFFEGNEGASAASSPVYPETRDTLSMAQLMQQYGIAASVLANNPSLVEALNRILGVGGGPMITDPALQQAIIMGTSWYRDQTDKQRQFDFFKATNPGQFAADLELNASKIVKQYASLGLTITADQAIEYAQNAMKQVIIKDGKVVRFDQDYLNKLMADSIKFTKTGNIDGRVTYTGLAGKLETMASELYQRAWNYGFPQTMSNEGFSNWFEGSMKGLVAGTMNPEDVDNLLQQRAKSFAPGLAKFIDQGQTLREAADPWLNALAMTWEVDPDSIDLNDDYVQRAINAQDEQGNIAPLNIYDTKKLGRRNKLKFDQTQQAKEEKTGIAQAILRDFGFLG